MDVGNTTRGLAALDGDVALSRQDDEGGGSDSGGGVSRGDAVRPWAPDDVVSEAIVADAHICDQVAALLYVPEVSVRRSLLGESLRVVLGVAGWLLLKEVSGQVAGDREGSACSRRCEALLLGWAERRRRGVWRRASDRRVDRCECGTPPKPKRSYEPEKSEDRENLCTVCRGSGVRLKVLGFPSGARVKETVVGCCDSEDGER